LSTSQPPMTLYGIAASSASCCNCCLIDIMVRMIMEMVGNRSFTLATRNGKRSRLRNLKNGIPHGSVLAPLLFNIHTSELPTTISRKYAFADDIQWQSCTLMEIGRQWKECRPRTWQL